MTRIAKTQHKITVCPLCGASMRCDNRVRVSMMWEYPDIKECGTRKVSCVNSKSTSKYICRECATKLSYSLGLPKPNEIYKKQFQNFLLTYCK